MKKLLVLLFICLSSTVLFAQTHYTPVTTGADLAGQNLSLTGYLAINHEYQDNPNLEIGVFDQDGVCRAAKVAKWYAKAQKYIFQLVIKGNEGFVYDCKVYDHESEAELPLTLDIDIVLTWSAGGKIGALGDLYEINFAGEVSEDLTLDITPYTSENGKDHYYIISSPVGEVPLENVENLRSNNYDLYYFDQNADDGLEWINEEQEHFETLVQGKGYLYANSGDGESDVVTLTFNGDPYMEEMYSMSLERIEGVEMAGWNLIGNPFTKEAYLVDQTRSFYVLDEETGALMEGEGAIPAMNGIFVYTEQDGEVLDLTTNNPNGKSARLTLNVSNGRNIIDRAAVRFNHGRQLPKFQLDKNSTKVYIPMGTEDFAVVNGEAQGEMPVNFKAEANGTYTISFTNQEVSFNYLHLIDNMTGDDVDLLANPSYSFEARTTDYASRFRLVFATGNATDDNFVFIGNGSLVINNEGTATMNVYDITGRLINTQNINGSCQVNFNATAGVYMIQLVNGTNTKTQKIVVK